MLSRNKIMVDIKVKGRCNTMLYSIPRISSMKTNVEYKEPWKRYLEIWWNGIKSLPQTTSIHGFKFIADTDRHWVER